MSQAPRMKGVPLPDVGHPDLLLSRAGSYSRAAPAPDKPKPKPGRRLAAAVALSPAPAHAPAHAPASFPPHAFHVRAYSDTDAGYATSPEGAAAARAYSATTTRARRGSDAARPGSSSSATPSPPLKGILKRSKHAQQPPIERASSVQPHHHARPAALPHGPRMHTPLRSFQPIPPERREDYSLHWQLLPHDPTKGKPRMHFDIRFAPAHAAHVDTRRASARALSPADGAKDACLVARRTMLLLARDLPDWRVEVFRADGVRVRDVLERIHETFAVVLTSAERVRLAPRVDACMPWATARAQAMRALDPGHVDRGMRRCDLLAGRTLFGGLEWIEPCSEYADGAWTMLLETPPVPPQQQQYTHQQYAHQQYAQQQYPQQMQYPLQRSHSRRSSHAGY